MGGGGGVAKSVSYVPVHGGIALQLISLEVGVVARSDKIVTQRLCHVLNKNEPTDITSTHTHTHTYTARDAKNTTAPEEVTSVEIKRVDEGRCIWTRADEAEPKTTSYNEEPEATLHNANGRKKSKGALDSSDSPDAKAIWHFFFSLARE